MTVIVAAFICGLFMDITWTRCVHCVQHSQAVKAANLSAILYTFTIVSTILIVEQNFAAVVAYALGGWIGTYVAVKWAARRLRGGEK